MSESVTALNCDQVAWIKDALRRYLEINRMSYPPISRIKAMTDTAFIFELCEIISAQLDEGAKHNATPPELRSKECSEDAVNLA